MKVELLYDLECPNVAATRENLSRALLLEKLPSNWTEWEQASADAPSYVRSFGSPTILIDGLDLAGIEPGNEPSCCRLYESTDNGRTGVPSVALIQAALLQAKVREKELRPAKQSLLALPGIAISILPFGGCPACWPVYGGILSALGLGVLLSSQYLLPLTAVFLLIALFTLAFRARTRRGYGPFAAGVMAAALILWGKFSLESNAVAYTGATLLIGSSLWNSWPPRAPSTPCPKCAPSDAELIQLSAMEKLS